MDPTGYVDGMNLYASYFVVNKGDPLGLVSWDEKWDAIKAIGPYDAWDASKAQADAYDAAKEYPGGHGGEGDAIRHCVLACGMTKRVKAEQAKKVLDNHERHSPPRVPECLKKRMCVDEKAWKEADQKMDFHNNDVGIKKGKMKGSSCKSACKKALKNNELQVNAPRGYCPS
jgi:hypothetical protein